ncbi:MAG TPA: class I adenylate-forming enzyme family protein [Acidimicrobiales bacterium]|nr:class I adenylate-forming enzyme family protein [Acidimicrobiales bacterium]
MPLGFAAAIAEVSAAGQPFEVVEVKIDGATQRAFRNAPQNLKQLFDTARGIDATFIVYEDEEWSFNDVMGEVDALAHALVHHYGVRPGDRVGIAMRNLPEWVISFAAIVSIGAVSVSLNAWWVEDEIAFAIEDSKMSVLIADAERTDRAERPCVRAGVHVLSVRLPEGRTLTTGIERWSDVVERGATMPEVTIGPDMDATILYTSGTTGVPKGAVSTHRAITQSIMAFTSRAAIDDLRREDPATPSLYPPCFILIVPLFHVTGCIPVMMSCFSWHFKLVMMQRWEPERALQLIEQHRVTAFVGVPTQSWDLVESPRFGDYDTSSLSSVGGGGAPAPPVLVSRVERSFSRGRPNLGYGMTETNAYGPGNSGDDYVAHPTSTGLVPTIVMDVQIRDPQGGVLGVDENGEIFLKSPTMFRGYWGRSHDTAEVLVDGWLRTGDIGRIDGDGYLYIEDRVKDMILRGGENIYPAEVEAAIYEHPAVVEAAVFGLPDDRLGEVVAGAIVVRRGSSLSAAQLHDFLATRLAAYMMPERVAFTDEPLPRNAAGKFLKREMPARYFA